MNRGYRLALLAAAVLLLAATGSVLATRAPQAAEQPAQATSSHEPEAQEVEGNALSRAAERLGVDEQALTELAATYGFGGAVRLHAWAADNDLGLNIDDIRDMRDGDGTEGSAMGWGQIAKELGVHPGIGSIMGNGGGHGRDTAPGQQGDEEDASGG